MDPEYMSSDPASDSYFRHTSFYLSFTLFQYSQISCILQIEALGETLHGAPFFQQHLLTVILCHVFVILAIFQTLHQRKHYNSLKAQMMI